MEGNTGQPKSMPNFSESMRKKVKKSDFGSYQLKYYVNGDEKLIGNVTLEEVSQRTNEFVGFAVGVALWVCIVALVIITVWKKKDILWFMKRYFGRSEKAGPNIYTASVLYKYSSANDDESMGHIKTLVNFVEIVVGKLGGTVYDQQRNVAESQYESKNILAMHGNCQRIVIILSSEFVKEHWSRYATYTAFESAIREGKKIILLTVPGTNESIQQIEDQPRTTLKSAMNRTTTIHWNGNLPFSGAFRRRLEYALPKLEKS